MRIPTLLLAMGSLLLLSACTGCSPDDLSKGKTTNSGSNAPDTGGSISHSSYACGKRYVVTIAYAALDKAPKWAEADENPPLSAKKALKAANDMKDSLMKDSEKPKWILRSLDLRPAGDDRWYWTANYEEEPLNGRRLAGQPPSLKLVVLMDGTAIKPEVTDDK